MINPAIVDTMIDKFQNMSANEYTDLHEQVLYKLDRVKEMIGAEDRSAASMLFLGFLIGSLRFPFENDPRNFLIANAQKKGLIISPRGFKRIGEMMFFQYQPENKSSLPYWDRYPMVIVTKKNKDGFEGLNLHYLPENYREIFMATISRFIIGDKDIQSAKTSRNLPRLRFDYKRFKSQRQFRYYKPCYKRYKYKNIRGRMLVIEPKYWDIAMYLPVHKFYKTGTPRVWSDSRKRIRKKNT